MCIIVKPEPSSLFTRVECHTASNRSLVIGFLWGLAEATLFFIVPDVYLGFVALFHWRKGLWTTLAATAGAVMGGTIMYALGAANAPAINQLLVRIPLISPELIHTVSDQMQASGLVSMVIGPLETIPYKIYAVQAGHQHLPFIPFLLVTILARLERMLPVALVGAALGAAFKGFVQRHTLLVISAYSLVWIGVYVLYYLKLR